MDYIVAGMISMLREGAVDTGMSFSDVQAACEEPDLHELDGFAVEEMNAKWEEAKSFFLGGKA